MIKITGSRLFDNFVLFLIVLSCGFMVFDNPSYATQVILQSSVSPGCYFKVYLLVDTDRYVYIEYRCYLYGKSGFYHSFYHRSRHQGKGVTENIYSS